MRLASTRKLFSSLFHPLCGLLLCIVVLLIGGCAGGSKGTNIGGGGTARLSTGAPAAGAKIMIEETGEEAFADAQGNYVLHNFVPNQFNTLIVTYPNGAIASFAVEVASASIQANFLQNQEGDIEIEIINNSDGNAGTSNSDQEDPMENIVGENPTNGNGSPQNGNSSGEQNVERPTPTKNPSEGSSEGEPTPIPTQPPVDLNLSLERCRTADFIDESGLINYTCITACQAEELENPRRYMAFYATDCESATSVLAAFVSACKNVECIDSCLLYIERYPGRAANAIAATCQGTPTPEPTPPSER